MEEHSVLVKFLIYFVKTSTLPTTYLRSFKSKTLHSIQNRKATYHKYKKSKISTVYCQTPKEVFIGAFSNAILITFRALHLPIHPTHKKEFPNTISEHKYQSHPLSSTVLVRFLEKPLIRGHCSSDKTRNKTTTRRNRI